MPLRTLEIGDTETAARIVDGAYTLLERTNPPSDRYQISRMGLCGAACMAVGDVAMRRMGIEATREFHTDHFLMNFLEGTGLAMGDDDPVMCLTWGQYADEDTFDRAVNIGKRGLVPAYFGPRVGLRELVGPENYAFQYSVQSINELSKTDLVLSACLWPAPLPGESV